ncbi:protein S100-A3 [Ornithorhynchus anatinus]|uniref:S100 calcium binding protein A3 n=1 Tax=Ornithorhynchus anatinus TaxID=9258 RepID=F6Q7S6_ORNAN|nr:protein S100-A3 [Ornithorhynchus anatinus]XP_016080939.1 protein S100-A3 [Ornithorhynchus anatinus]XP_028911979.1 protein S100-A3 [Ornithorhynchus anatinus]
MSRPLEEAMMAVICTFREYAAKCGDPYKLSKGELKELLLKELPSFTPSQLSECDYNQLFNALDVDKDCEVNFQEYITALSSLAVLCNEFFRDCPRDCPAEPTCPK